MGLSGERKNGERKKERRKGWSDAAAGRGRRWKERHRERVRKRVDGRKRDGSQSERER